MPQFISNSFGEENKPKDQTTEKLLQILIARNPIDYCSQDMIDKTLSKMKKSTPYCPT